MFNKLPIFRRDFLQVSAGAVLSQAATPFTSAAQARRPNAARVKIEKNVVIGKGGDIDLHCDIYHPPVGSEKRMALVHFHGGGFARGSKDTLADQVTPITMRGYLSIAAQYRLSGVAKWPAAIDDAKTHIRWVRANAGMLGVDANRIAVVGHSAGGHIALFTAGQPDLELAACVAFYPQTDVSSVAQALMPGASEAAINDASPLAHVKKGYPATVIFHGLSDMAIPAENSQHVLQVLRAANVASELHTFAGAPHEFDRHPEFAECCAVLTDLFLEREVLHSQRYLDAFAQPLFQPPAAR